MADKDLYKYFRIEARELLESLTQGVLELEKGTFSKDLIGRLLRHAHTLKGAARIVNQPGISESSHRIEDILAPHREGGEHLPRQRINDLLSLVDAIAASLRELDPPGDPRGRAASAAAAPLAVEEPFEAVRIEIREMDGLLHGASRAGISINALRQDLASLDRALQLAATRAAERGMRGEGEVHAGQRASEAEELRALLRRLRQSLIVAADRAARELTGVQERAADLRLLPASAVFASLERAARDAAESTGKQVHFHASGGENRLDAHVLRALRDALVHVVRNAVAHGVETGEERLAAGKPAAGRVELNVERQGNRVVFTCRDDGRGISVEQVRRAAVERGLVSAAEASSLSSQAAIELLLRGGLSTMHTVTQVSGRGVGLDVVRATVARLKGEVAASAEAGRGTTLSIAAPISLESLAVLEVESAGSTVSLPFDAVAGSLRIGQSDLARSPTGDAILWAGQTIPFVPLAGLLGRSPGPVTPTRFWSVIVLRADSELAAVGVDRLLGRVNVVMRPLPRLAGPIELLAGASFDSEGNPQPVLDASALVRAVRRHPPAAAEPAAPRKLPLLVIDDSLTTRMLEQSILQTAGYEVDLAVSGEEALQKSRQKRYAMFVVDIEMPGINGFEFIEQVRADPQLREIPAILVTSRASAEDRRRGEQVGARAYIIKSEFDEGQLLRTIRELVG